MGAESAGAGILFCAASSWSLGKEIENLKDRNTLRKL